MSKKHNQAGDVLTQNLSYAILEQLDDSDLKKWEDISHIMPKILSQILTKPVTICYRRFPRNFPQLFTEDSMLIIRCFYSESSSNSSKWKNLSLQLCVIKHDSTRSLRIKQSDGKYVRFSYAGTSFILHEKVKISLL